MRLCKGTEYLQLIFKDAVWADRDTFVISANSINHDLSGWPDKIEALLENLWRACGVDYDIKALSLIHISS